mmetsp:Transcript_21008/g.63145  ORF Transcript_21008/g.63145 Transcript_21008/m.63145 type:complete len:398 (+) Transcript_21008:241-1434(+)
MLQSLPQVLADRIVLDTAQALLLGPDWHRPRPTHWAETALVLRPGLALQEPRERGGRLVALAGGKRGGRLGALARDEPGRWPVWVRLARHGWARDAVRLEGAVEGAAPRVGRRRGRRTRARPPRLREPPRSRPARRVLPRRAARVPAARAGPRRRALCADPHARALRRAPRPLLRRERRRRARPPARRVRHRVPRPQAGEPHPRHRGLPQARRLWARQAVARRGRAGRGGRGGSGGGFVSHALRHARVPGARDGCDAGARAAGRLVGCGRACVRDDARTHALLRPRRRRRRAAALPQHREPRVPRLLRRVSPAAPPFFRQAAAAAQPGDPPRLASGRGGRRLAGRPRARVAARRGVGGARGVAPPRPALAAADDAWRGRRGGRLQRGASRAASRGAG